MRLLSPGAMIRALLLAALVLPLTAVGCATAQSASGDASSSMADGIDIETPAMDEPFRLGVGETARVDGHAVRFVEVAEDSRCPQGVDCIRAGEARIRVEVDGEPVTLTLANGMLRDGDTADVRVGTQMLSVTALMPYPGSAAAQAGDPVEAMFVVAAG